LRTDSKALFLTEITVTDAAPACLGGTAHDIFDRFIRGGYDAYILDDQARLTRVTAMTAASDYLFMPVARP